MKILELNGLCKRYPAFQLSDVSFSLEEGKITGFIGRNGAGKTTTLKSMIDFVHPDEGEIKFFGGSFAEKELEIKSRIAFVSGGVDYYPTKKLKTITDVTRRFYRDWDQAAYEGYLARFSLDENKTPAQLSAGMKVKYALALALSHRAGLLILDEPTSGLDPVSRDDLLDLFLELRREGVTILFSTHITSDLDKCADDIVYIKNGRILASGDMKEFLEGYRTLTLEDGQLTDELRPRLIGLKPAKEGYTAIIRAEDAQGLDCGAADLEAVMIHMEKEGRV